MLAQMKSRLSSAKPLTAGTIALANNILWKISANFLISFHISVYLLSFSVLQQRMPNEGIQQPR